MTVAAPVPIVPPPHPPGAAGAPALSAVPSTLRIPLAARAHGDRLFPRVAVGDVHAARCLAAIGDDGSPWLQDLPSVYGVLARTHMVRAQAATFLARQPDGLIVNLGCGLSHYFQWLDNGRCRIVEADLQEVVDLRHRLRLSGGPRQSLAVADVREPGWWDRLALPRDHRAPAVFVLCEGVLMYLHPWQVRAVLAEFGARAPAGSVLMFDALSAVAVGQARLHPSVGRTGAEFTWGPARLADVTAPHARLQLLSARSVMDGYAPWAAMMGWSFQFVMGAPFYAMYALQARDPMH